MEKRPRVLVFAEAASLAPKGGPSAVCYFYNEELKRRQSDAFEFLPSAPEDTVLHQKEAKYLSQMPAFWSGIYGELKSIVKTNVLLGGRYPVRHIDFSAYDIVHFHDVRLLYTYRYELESYKGIVVLQSHTPQPTGHEIMNNISAFVRFFIPAMKKRFEAMDRYAFERADYIIFPCPDAEEPYFNDWPYYKRIHKNKEKSYKYVLTGIPACVPKRSLEEIRAELGRGEDDFIVSYVGRHNKVKGFDLLKQIGERYLAEDPSAYFIAAGKEEPICGLEHPHWKELGWTDDAHSYIAASDVFILPNRETYFDIVLLEVMSLGKIVIASRTGGNKYFEKAGCGGIFLYDTMEEAVGYLRTIREMSKEERMETGRKNLEFFNGHNSVESMFDSYVATLNDIYRERTNGKVNQG